MESAMSRSPRPLLRLRDAPPRIVPSTIASIAIEGLGTKNMAWSGIGKPSASRIIAQWAAWRRQTFEQMLIDHERDSENLASLQVVSTMLDASFLRASAAGKDDHGSGRRVSTGLIAREGTVPASRQGFPRGNGMLGRGSHGKGDADVKQRGTLCGWQGRRHVVARELQALSEHRAVSNFVHRDCIESFFRSRFYFRGGWPMQDDEGSVSMATSSTTADHSDTDQEQMNGYDDEYSDSGYSEHGSEESGSSYATLTDNIVQQEAGSPYGLQNEEGGAFLDGDDEQHVMDGFYGLELPEHLTRGSVSYLLSNGFSGSLDQLLTQSHRRRQELAEIRQMLNTAASVAQDHVDHEINEPNQAEYGQPWIVSSGQGPRRQRRQWSWTHPDLVVDAIKDLQIDMIGLHRQMASVQHMVEESMKMQVEVQRSIRQEVSAAMNRSIGVPGSHEGQLDDPSRWNLVRKGTCCVCCENQIDSLLYRCGHMCTCSKCASELINGDGKCPMCRAPIIDVVRAYTT